MSYSNRIIETNIEFVFTNEDIEKISVDFKNYIDFKKMIKLKLNHLAIPEFIFQIFKNHGWYTHFLEVNYVYRVRLGHTLHEIPNIFELKNSLMYKILDILKIYISNLDAYITHAGEERLDLHKITVQVDLIKIYKIQKIIWEEL